MEASVSKIIHRNIFSTILFKETTMQKIRSAWEIDLYIKNAYN